MKLINAIHLQGIGNVDAIPAGEVKPGMRIAYNFGSLYEVLAVEPFKQSVRITERRMECGTVYVRVARVNRLLAAFYPKAA